MAHTVHVIGNGDSAQTYKPSKGLKVVCNLPPMAVENVWASVIVDFKMMAALTEGSVEIPYNWVCGFRPKMWMEKHPAFHFSKASQIREFYTELPTYALLGGKDKGMGYTNMNCGHVATHYSANRLDAQEIHLYGFDSIFEFSTKSSTDFVLNSDRGDQNTNRLTGNWRKVWDGIFREFHDRKFFLHYHKASDPKMILHNNVEIVRH
jgi:hypothetical protein